MTDTEILEYVDTVLTINRQELERMYRIRFPAEYASQYQTDRPGTWSLRRLRVDLITAMWMEDKISKGASNVKAP